MRRADRLFRILQILRRSRRPVTAERLADELGVTKRTIYRDVAALLAQHVPLRGEAGVGYVLGRDFDMPPLMLTADELEAPVLGAQWVADRADPVLARAARDLIAKILHAVPERLREFVIHPAIGAPAARTQIVDGLDLAKTREWVRTGRKLRLRYRDEHDEITTRVVWPVLIGYAETVRLLAAWCELRRDFRHFRTDRVVDAEFLDEKYDSDPPDLRRRWERHMRARGIRLPE